jgi:hypothetical protein
VSDEITIDENAPPPPPTPRSEPPRHVEVSFEVDYAASVMHVRIALPYPWYGYATGEARTAFIYAAPGSPEQLRAMADLLEIDMAVRGKARPVDPLAPADRRLTLE